MSVGDVALGILDHGGSAVLASALTWVAVRASGSRGEISRDDRGIEDLNEDLRRWVRDRDRELTIEHKLIQHRYNSPDSVPEWREQVPEELRHLPAGSQYHSGAHVAAHAEGQRQALHEYRDDATRKIREYEEIVDREGWLHRQWRKRRGRPLARLVLPADCREALARWRAPARVPGMNHESPVEDPTQPELEPELAALERDPLTPRSPGWSAGLRRGDGHPVDRDRRRKTPIGPRRSGRVTLIARWR